MTHAGGPNGSGPPPEIGLLERIEAGTYYFGQGDYVAARAWWDYALEIDPHNAGVLECVRCLDEIEQSAPSESVDDDAIEGEADSFPPVRHVSDALEFPEMTDYPEPPSYKELPQADQQGNTARGSADGFESVDTIESSVPDPAPPEAFGEEPTEDSSGYSIESEAAISEPAAWIDDDDYDQSPPPVAPPAAPERWSWRPDAPPSTDPFDFATQSSVHPPAPPAEAPPSTPWDDGPTHSGSEPPPPPSPPSDDFAEYPPHGSIAPPETLLSHARDRIALDDLAGAIELLRGVPSQHPLSHEARDLEDRAEHRLTQIYEAKLGSFEAAPRILVSGEQLIWLNFDHRVGYLLSQVDGSSSFDDLIAVSGMPRFDTLRILCFLLDQGVIAT